MLNMALAFAAGIMVFISFNELGPISLKYGEEHMAITSLFSGIVMMISILLLLK